MTESKAMIENISGSNETRWQGAARKWAKVPARSRGFTLIESMIVVSIIAILASVALPSYSAYASRGKISQATSQLGGMSVTLQQYYQDNRSYAGACAAGSTAPLPSATNGDFTYSCPKLTETEYSVVATGKSGTRVAGLVYTIDQNGNRATTAAPAGWATSTACWVTAKNGSCT